MRRVLIVMLLLCFRRLLTKSTLQVNLQSPCEKLRCENQSLCKQTTMPSGNGSTIVKVMCECNGRYVGSRCHKILTITILKTSSNSISYTVNAINQNQSVDILHELHYTYTLHYWKNSTESTCTIVPGVTGTRQTLTQLLPETVYTLCPLSGDVRYCTSHEYVTNSSLSCVEIHTTKLLLYNRYDSVFIIVGIFAGITLLVLSVICLYCVVRKNNSSHRKRTRRKSYRYSESESFLPTRDSSKYTPIIRPPTSPGRPPFKLSKQPSGYKAFTAKNNRTIAMETVLE